MMYHTKGTARDVVTDDSSPPEQAHPLSSHRGVRRPSGKPSLNRPLLLILLLIATAAAVVWGVPRHPLYLEWRYSRLSLPELDRASAGRLDDTRLLYYMGRRLNERQRFAEADPILRSAVERDPDSPRLREEWTRALLGSGLTSAAFGQLQQFAGTHPDLPEAHLMLGKFYFTQRSMKRASEEMEKAIALDPKNAEAYSYLAGAKEALGEIDSARKAIDTALRLRPGHARDRLMSASLRDRANRLKEARQEFERAVALAPGDAVVRREHGAWLLGRGDRGAADRRQAAAEAREAARLDPNDPEALRILGQALIADGRDTEAVEPLARAAELAGDDPAAPQSLAILLRRVGKKEEAARWEKAFRERQAFATKHKLLDEAIRQSPADGGLHKRMARLLGSRGDVEGCIRHHAAAQRRPPDSPTVLAAAAVDLAEQKHAEKALPLAKRAVEISAYSPATHEALGDTYLGLGRYHQAGLSYNTAMGLLPARRPVIRQKMARYLNEREANPPPAEIAFQKAQRLETENIGPQPITEEVEKLAEKAAALEPYNHTYLWYLMNVKVGRRKTEEAIETGRRLLTEAPEFAKGHAMMAVLLAEYAATPEDEKAIDEHLKLAGKAAESAPTLHYARGLLALRRKQGAAAARELRQAAQLDPEATVTYYKLAQAEEMAGNKEAARRAMALFRALQKDKQEQADALSRIAQAPDDPKAYADAARLFESHGLKEQAEAIRDEARRRFAKPQRVRTSSVRKPAPESRNKSG